MPKLKSALVLVAFLAISFTVAALGGIATTSQVDGWYADADKVAWTPPNVVFGPVWTALYAAMSIAAWRVWLERKRVDVRRPLTLISFWPVSRLAAALFVPYLAWVLYATTLNIGAAVLNS